MITWKSAAGPLEGNHLVMLHLSAQALAEHVCVISFHFYWACSSVLTRETSLCASKVIASLVVTQAQVMKRNNKCTTDKGFILCIPSKVNTHKYNGIICGAGSWTAATLLTET